MSRYKNRRNSYCIACLCAYCDMKTCRKRPKKDCISCQYDKRVLECPFFHHQQRERKVYKIKRHYQAIDRFSLLRLKLTLDDMFIEEEFYKTYKQNLDKNLGKLYNEKNE